MAGYLIISMKIENINKIILWRAVRAKSHSHWIFYLGLQTMEIERRTKLEGTDSGGVKKKRLRQGGDACEAKRWIREIQAA